MNKATHNRIVVIEDNPSFLKMLKLRLESSGYQVTAAENGLTGLDTIRKKKPDLVILDIMLPGLDGHKVCRMVKFDRNLHSIPVIILTSRDTDETADLAKRCGADAFLLKTTKTPIVLEVIRKLINRKNDL
jgi:two-component system alkaline phosphatase synthesis response regulator PhoP